MALTPEKIFLVGGAVRDQALGLKVADRDYVVVGSTPEEMIELGFKPVGADFPVFIDKSSGSEYALARTERKTARGYQGFAVNTSTEVTLEQDLERRDITINAMAKDNVGNLIDPFGGMRDLENKVIRHVSAAFAEDPVRVLRVARFAARFGFTVAEETVKLMRQMVDSGEVDALVPERVWAELHKALCTQAPATFLQTLRDCGALAKILPEVDALFGIPQTETYHPEIDTGIHTLMVVEQASKLSDDTQVRFAAMVHDLGKAVTPKSVLPSHKGHERAGLPIIKSLCERLRVPKKHRQLALAVSEYHLHMHKMYELKPTTVLKMLQATKALNDRNRAEHIALCCTADAKGRKGLEQKPYPQAELFLRFQQAASSIDAHNIAEQHKGNGQAIKQALHKARAAAIAEIKATL